MLGGIPDRAKPRVRLLSTGTRCALRGFGEATSRIDRAEQIIVRSDEFHAGNEASPQGKSKRRIHGQVQSRGIMCGGGAKEVRRRCEGAAGAIRLGFQARGFKARDLRHIGRMDMDSHNENG
jgi:hypothetical protein